MSNVNSIAFVLHSHSDIWEGHKSTTETLNILIDGRNLIDIVREVERPFAIAEGHPDMAGGYSGLLADDPLLLSKRLMGEHDDYVSADGKTLVLICSDCGEPGCWPLVVRITKTADTVTWSDFAQPHRVQPKAPAVPWRYDGLGPFVFDRQQYEQAVATCRTEFWGRGAGLSDRP